MRSIATIIALIINVFFLNGQIKEYKYRPWLKNINAAVMHQAGLTGKGVKIGIIDAGFRRSKTEIHTKQLFENGQIKLEKNFVKDTVSSIYAPKTDHGFISLAQTSGLKNDSIFYGMAYEADFYLARTEFGKKDYRIEEKNFEEAVEELYNLGVRLINVSLSYTDNFENEDENYSVEDIDGKTAYITKVCNKWAEKGIIFIVGAGNKGLNKWKTLGAPADAKDIITVGSTGPSLAKISRLNERTIFKAGFSSVGNEQLPYIKPDIVVYSAWGTSFSAPATTGLVACILQKDSTLTIHKIKEILIKSSNLYHCPNNYVGHGLPDCGKILKLLNNKEIKTIQPKQMEAARKITLIANSDDIVAFHKKNTTIVLKQRRLKAKTEKVVVKQEANAKFTTIVIGKTEIVEVKWK